MYATVPYQKSAVMSGEPKNIINIPHTKKCHQWNQYTIKINTALINNQFISPFSGSTIKRNRTKQKETQNEQINRTKSSAQLATANCYVNIGDAEIAGLENEGTENEGPSVGGGKRGNRKTRDRQSGVENEGTE